MIFPIWTIDMQYVLALNSKYSGVSRKSSSKLSTSQSLLLAPGFNLRFLAKGGNFSIFHFKILTELCKMIQRLCAGGGSDLHLCCVCWLCIHSRISPHPQHQFLNEVVCIFSEGGEKRDLLLLIWACYITHTFSAVEKAALLTCSSSSDNPDSCKGGNFSPR